MEKTKDITYRIDDIDRVFRLHAMQFTDLALIRDAISASIISPNKSVTKEISEVILKSVEMIGEGGVSHGFCKLEELSALLSDPFALYDIICEALEFQKTFCNAYQKSRNLISSAILLVSASDTELT